MSTELCARELPEHGIWQPIISHGMWPLEMSFLIHNMNSGGISRKASHQQVVFLRRYIYTIVNTVSKVSTGREQHP